ncbi:MAG: Asp-tRNA(Asn)/Glu-tRNA(Gln) amidotransferase subunit GatC [Lachnospiraceae bacterium]|jgi:aspartyl-tRNA(Asn)/glutamyl-tRNA(Gln) amidotransferase subunit C|nr:Asp-tRNA(Asn)/Glu-tRNA(Gln) amidotransferase subunit GatC [Lachnospiraceae bacterium]
MEITREEIMHIAKLANLKIEDSETQKYVNNMKEILNFANTVNEVDTDNIDTSIHAVETFNRFRKDEIHEFGDRDILLANAPEQENGMFKIPKVI